MLKRLTVLALLLLSATGARAAIQVDFVGKTPSATGFEYSYTATLSSQSSLAAGDYFAIYDFAGITNLLPTNFTEDSGVPGFDPTVTRWSLTQQNQGPLPGAGTPTDDLTSPNILATYNGAPIDANPGSAGLLLGTLKLTSFIGTEHEIDFGSLTHQQTHAGQGYLVGPTTGPIPEPSTVTLMGAGLLAVAGLALRRRSRKR